MVLIETAIDKLREQGFKVTPQRIAILKALLNNTAHPTAEAIYELVRVEHPTMSLNTVYKTLEVLGSIGEVVVLNVKEGRNHFDPNTSPHHHFVCRRCRKILDVHGDYSDAFVVPTDLKDRHQVEGYQVEFFGVCKECEARGADG